VVLAPLDDLFEDSVVDLHTVSDACRWASRADGWRLTLGMGIASSTSPTSSSMFLMRTERSATSLSIADTMGLAQRIVESEVRLGVECVWERTDADGDSVGAHKLDLRNHFVLLEKLKIGGAFWGGSCSRLMREGNEEWL
jgi:hypothetical protein